MFCFRNVIYFVFILVSQDLHAKSIYLIRHAQTSPGYGDPKGFDITKCETQRNLSEDGKEQAKKIGKFFVDNKIKIHKVYSSPWCRCKDTAQIAFGQFEVLKELGSPLGKEWETDFTERLRAKIKSHSFDGALVLVAHHFVIENLLDIVPAQGEVVQIDNEDTDFIKRYRLK